MYVIDLRRDLGASGQSDLAEAAVALEDAWT
jgi:hypothetical protein